MYKFSERENRQSNRSASVFNGAFFVKNGGTGPLIITDFSRSGIRALLKNKLSVGTKIRFEIMPLVSFMPIFATGKIMWIKTRNGNMTYRFEAGIKSNMPDFLNKERIVEYCHKKWFLKMVSDYALNRGYLARKLSGTPLHIKYFYPSIFLLYILVGAGFSIFNKVLLSIYLISIFSYFLWILKSTRTKLMKGRQIKRYAIKPKLILSVGLGRVFGHFCYGLFFILGLLGIKTPE